MRKLRIVLLVAAHLLVLLHNLVPHTHNPGQAQTGLLGRALSLVAHSSGEAFRFDVVQARTLRQVQPVAAPRAHAQLPQRPPLLNDVAMPAFVVAGPLARTISARPDRGPPMA